MKDKTMKLDLQMFATASTQNQNATGASGMSAEMKTFYEKRLIDQAEPALVHDQFGDPYPIPANGGKDLGVAATLERWASTRVKRLPLATARTTCRCSRPWAQVWPWATRRTR